MVLNLDFYRSHPGLDPGSAEVEKLMITNFKKRIKTDAETSSA